MAIAYCAGEGRKKFSPIDLNVTDNEPCNGTAKFRLKKFGENSILGRLEMCYDGYWGSVCNDYADHVTAAIACRELGYNNTLRGQYVLNKYKYIL